MAWDKATQAKFPEQWLETKEKISNSLKGHTPWNKGKTKVEFPQMSNSGNRTGTSWNKDIKLSESHKLAMRGKRKPFSLESRQNMKGRTPWNKIYFGERDADPMRALYISLEYKRFRFEMFKRDGFKCVQCNSKETIQLDHIKSKSRFPELVMAEWNVRTLCFECHKKTPTWGVGSWKLNKIKL